MAEMHRVRLVLSGFLPTSEPSALETHGMDAQIDDADTDAAAGEQTGRYVRIDQGIKIVQEESALIWGNAHPSLQPVFRPGQRAGPGQDLDQNAPHQGAKV